MTSAIRIFPARTAMRSFRWKNCGKWSRRKGQADNAGELKKSYEAQNSQGTALPAPPGFRNSYEFLLDFQQVLAFRERAAANDFNRRGQGYALELRVALKRLRADFHHRQTRYRVRNGQRRCHAVVLDDHNASRVVTNREHEVACHGECLVDRFQLRIAGQRLNRDGVVARLQQLQTRHRVVQRRRFAQQRSRAIRRGQQQLILRCAASSRPRHRQVVALLRGRNGHGQRIVGHIQRQGLRRGKLASGRSVVGLELKRADTVAVAQRSEGALDNRHIASRRVAGICLAVHIQDDLRRVLGVDRERHRHIQLHAAGIHGEVDDFRLVDHGRRQCNHVRLKLFARRRAVVRLELNRTDAAIIPQRRERHRELVLRHAGRYVLKAAVHLPVDIHQQLRRVVQINSEFNLLAQHRGRLVNLDIRNHGGSSRTTRQGNGGCGGLVAADCAVVGLNAMVRLPPLFPQRRERHGEGVFRHIRGDVLEEVVDTAVDVHQHLRGVLDAQGEGQYVAQRRIRIADFQQLNPRLVRHADGNRLGVGHHAACSL